MIPRVIMTESTTPESSDIAASELMEKFDISKEQADKLAKALPELCKEFSKEEKNPDQRQQYPYPYPYPFPVPAQRLELNPDMVKELTEFGKAAAEELMSMGDILQIEDITGQLEGDELQAVMDTTLTNFNTVIDTILEIMEADEENEGEEEPDEEDQRRRIAQRFQEREPLARIAEIVLRPLRAFFARRRVPQQQYPYPYPLPTARQPARQARRPLTFVSRFTPQRASGDAAAADLKPIYIDSIPLDLDAESIKVGEDGVLTAGCVATAAMVQDYDSKKVLKCPDELKLAVDFARQLPIGHNHPQDGIITEQDQIKGWTTPVQYDEKNKRISCDVEIEDAALVKDIRDNRKTDVSIGFFCDLDETPGEFNGVKYDAVQRNIVLNHLAAGIDNGRCPGGTCGIGQDAVKDCENCPEKETCPKSDVKPPATDSQIEPTPNTPAMDKLGEDASVEMHEKLLKEQVDAVKALGNKIAEGASTMKADELSALANQLSSMTYEIQNTARVVQTKNLSVDEQLLTDATKEISSAWKIATDVLTKPLFDAKYLLEKADGHTHTADLDEKGNGTSSKDDGHSHKIIGRKVMFTNGHIHKLKKAADEGDRETAPEANPPPADQAILTPENKDAARKHFKMTKEEWEALSEKEEVELIRKYQRETKKDENPPAKGGNQPKDKTDAEKALDLKKLETVDAIMDFNPPEPRETYEAMAMDELDKTLVLIKSQSSGGSIHRSGSSTTDRRKSIDDAYADLEKRKSGRK
jgi:hypothetical protein